MTEATGAVPARQYQPNPQEPDSPRRIVASAFSGPLPPPGLLSNYEAACPGSAERIMRWAEQEAEHRRAAELAIINAQIEESRREFSEARCGQICALVITLAALGTGAYTAITGHEWAGGIIGVGGVGGIVTTFILGKRKAGEGQPQAPPNKKPKRKK